MGEEAKNFEKKEYNELINGMKDAVFIHDLEGNFLTVNDEAVNRLGYSREELLDLKPQDIDGPKNSEKVKERIKDVEEEETLVFETVHITKDGKEIPVEINSSLITYQGKPAVLSVARDISNRKEMEEKLHLTDFSLNHASLEVYWITPEGKFVYANETTSNRLEYSREELKNMHVWDIDPDHGEEIREERWEKLKEEKTMTFESEHETKSGEVYPVEITNHYIEFRGEEYEFAFAKDITGLKKAKKRNDFLNTLLRQDLGAQYQIVQGYLQLLKDELDISKKHEEYLEKSIKSSKKADEILTLAKKLEEIEETDWTDEKDITKDMNSAIENISDLIEEKGIEIEKDYPKNISKVRGDYSLNTLLTHLLITRIQLGKCNRIRIVAEKKEENILLRIEDDGKQLPKEVKKIFTGEIYTGETSGIGGVRYYMLREIAKHNKAKIEVKDSDLDGACFNIQLEKA